MVVLADCPIRDFNISNVMVDPTAFYTALWNSSELRMFTLDVIESGKDFRFTAFNQACAENSPIPVETLKHQRLTDVFPPEISADYLAQYQHCLTTNQTTSFESALPIDGDVTYWKLSVHPLITKTGENKEEVNQLLVVNTDITADKRNLRLMKSRQILQQVIDTVPAVIVWKDTDSNYLGGNRHFLKISGLERFEDIPGKTDYDMPWKKEEADFFIECDRRVMQQNKAELNIIEPQLQANGRQAWLKTSKIPLHDQQGDVIGILVIVNDITEEKATQDRQMQLLEILSATPDIVSIYDAQGNCNYLNQSGQETFNLSSEKIESLRIQTLSHPNETEKLIQAAMPVAKQTGIWTGESLIRDSQGQDIPVSHVIICHKSETGEVEYFSSIMRNMSDRQAIETVLREQSDELSHTLQQLQKTQGQIIQAEKMSSLGQMVAGIAHEINNPVNFIHGNIRPASNYVSDLLDIIDVYRETYPQSTPDIDATLEELDLEFIREDLPKLIQSMSMGTSRIREIVLSLRNFSRLDESEVKTVDLHEGIDSTLVILSHRFKNDNVHKAIKVVKAYGNLPLVSCYPSQLNQVLMNILANAIDALEQEKDPIITVFTEQKGENVSIRIRDNGSGIPKDIQPQILDPFFTTKGVGKGTGMGMSISYQIVTEKHGGQLMFTSEEGDGTEFCITIPIHQPENT